MARFSTPRRWSLAASFERLLGWLAGPEPSRRRRPARLALEALEDRVTPTTTTTITVSNLSNSQSVTGSLPFAVARADADTSGTPIVINFASGAGQVFAKAQTINLLNVLDLNNTHTGTSITIQGPAAGLTIAGGGSSTNFSVFKVESGTTVTIDSVTIANGSITSAGSGGAGIDNLGTLTLDTVTLRGNTATGGADGGGILNAIGASLTVTGSTLTGNKCSGSGGGIENLGTASVTGTTFTNNTAGNNGGGIDNGAVLTVTNTTFSGNTTTNAGGGISDNSGTANVAGSTLMGNHANAGAGAFAGNHGTLTLVNDTVANNTARGGAGLFVDVASTLVVTGCTITGNTANGRTNSAGGIDDYNTLVLNDSIVANNSGGIHPDINANGGPITGGHNLIGVAGNIASAGLTDGQNGNIIGHPALLANLGNHGGATQTVGLLPGSPALGGAGAITTVGAAATTTDATITLTNATVLAAGISHTTIAAASNGAALPQATIAVASTADFPSAGTITVAINTTIDVSSNGAALPQATINVASTAGFPSAGTMTITLNGTPTTVSYSGLTATSFTGCSGGSGTLTTGAIVSGGSTTVTYTGTTPTSFTGCTGGTGTLTTGTAVSGPSGHVPAGLNIVIDGEEMTVTGVNLPKNTITVTRGVNGVSAAFAANDPVFLFTDQRAIARTATTTIAAASDSAALPQATINVASTAGFPSAGTITITLNGTPTTVSYTGITATSFTGCTGGTGTLATGATVTANLGGDIGSFQDQGFTLTPVTGSASQFTNVNTSFPKPLAVTVASKDTGVTINGGTISFSVTPGTGSNPPSATLSAAGATIGADGVASVTATANANTGSYTVTAAIGSAIATFNLTNEPAPPSAPTFTSANNATFTVGTQKSFTVTATGSPTPTLSEQNGETPPGSLTFTPSTGILSGTPAADSSGVYTLHFIATTGTTTIAAASNGAALPQATINVASTAQFPSSGTITITINGTPTTVKYTGITATSFTGCTGGTGTLSTGAAVADSVTQTFTLTIDGKPVVTTPPGSPTVNEGSTVTLTAAARGAPTPTVQWQVSTDGGTTYTNILGATSTTLTFPATAARNGEMFQAVFSNSFGSTTSSAGTLTVDFAPEITTQPQSIGVTAGTAVTLTAAATSNPSPPSVQWQQLTPTGFQDIPNETSLQLVIQNPTDGSQYRAVFKTTVGQTTLQTISQVATVTVGTVPTVTTPPGDATVKAGDSVSFTAVPAGTPTPTVQWQVSTNGQPFVNIPGATAQTLTFTAQAAQNGNKYQAVFTNIVGQKTSSSATLTVNFAPQITTQPTDKGVEVGSDAVFTVQANANPAATIHWQVKTPTSSTFTDTGDTGSTLTLTNTTLAESGNQYRARITYTLGTVTTTSFSQAAKLTVGHAPVASPPASTSVTANVGQQVQLVADASGTPTPTVQWQVSTDGVHFTNIAGATSRTLSFTAQPAQNGNLYQAVFTNAIGQATTTPITLTVNFALVVTTQPANQTVAVGGSATFTAAVNANPAATGQWQELDPGQTSFKNVTTGANVTVNGNTLTISSITAAQNGTKYRETFTNSQGTVFTSAARLIVDVAPTIATQPGDIAAQAGQMVTFTATATGTPAPTVQWQVSIDGGTTYTNIAGATSTTLTFKALASQNGFRYRAVFTNPVGAPPSSGAKLVIW